MVIIFSGIPGCGKTTIAKKLAARLKKHGTVRLFISDNLTPPVYKKFFTLLKIHKGAFYFLIFDATFYLKTWRDKMEKIAAGEPMITIYVRSSLKTALRRNKRRSPRVPEKAVHIIYRRFQPPEHADVVIDTDKTTADKAVTEILRVLKAMPKFAEEIR